MTDCGDHLHKNISCLFFSELANLYQAIQETSLCCHLHDEVELRVGLDDLKQPDNVGVQESLHACNLVGKKLAALIIKLSLLNDLYSNFLCSGDRERNAMSWQRDEGGKY